MQGKLVLSQSRSIVLSRKRLCFMWGSHETKINLKIVQAQEGINPPARTVYFNVKSAVLSPLTLIFLDWSFLPSCQAKSVYGPSGTLAMWKLPSAAVSAKYGVGDTIM